MRSFFLGAFMGAPVGAISPENGRVSARAPVAEGILGPGRNCYFMGRFTGAHLFCAKGKDGLKVLGTLMESAAYAPSTDPWKASKVPEAWARATKAQGLALRYGGTRGLYVPLKRCGGTG